MPRSVRAPTIAMAFFGGWLSSQTFADSGCSYDVLGMQPGMAKETVEDLMTKRGLRAMAFGRERNLGFTNRKPWPPEDVELSSLQLKLLSMNPERRKQLESRAQNNPELEKALTGLKDMPPRPEPGNPEMTVYLSGVTETSPGDTPIRGIHVRYLFSADVNAREPVFSPEHLSLRDDRWETYCTGPDIRCRDKEKDGKDLAFDIIIHPKAGNGDGRCNYKFISRPQEANEELSLY